MLSSTHIRYLLAGPVRKFAFAIAVWGFSTLTCSTGIFARASAGPNKGHDSSGKSIFLYTHDLWQTENGLPQNSVSAILQTRDGRLWLGTLEGLVQFDGTQFTVRNSSNTPELHSNRVLTLQEDKVGRLWVGTEDGGVTCFEGNHPFHVGKAEGLASEGVGALGTDSSGAVWIGTGNGLFRYADGKLNAFTVADGLQSNVIRALTLDKNGALLAATNRGIARFESGRFVTAFTYLNKELPPAWAMRRTRDGSVWVASQVGLYRYRDGVTRKYDRGDGLSSSFVWSLGEDAAGRLLVGTHGAGMDILEDDRFVNYSTKDGLSSPFVWSIGSDREGSIWIGTNGGGLNRLKDDTFTSYTEQAGLQNNFVWSVTEDTRHAIWIGTYDGLDRLQGGRFTHFGTRNGLRSTFVWSVCSDGEGTLWVGTPDGLHKFNGTGFDVFTKKNGLPSSTVRSLFCDRAGTLWIGTAAGFCAYRNGRFRSYPAIDTSSPSNVIMSIAEDTAGGTWFGSTGGLIHFAHGKFDTLRSKDGLPSEIIRAVKGDNDGTLWIGTQGGGLAFLRNGKIATVTKRDGLYDDVISVILDDGAGSLWMSCNNGVFSVEKSELYAFADGRAHDVHCREYDRGDGMSSKECNGSSQPAGWRSDDGTLWFPTIKGVVSVNPAKIIRNTIPPPVLVEKLIANGVEFPADSIVHLPAGSRDFEVHYAGLSFRAPEKMKFEYILDGFDQRWSQVGRRRVAYFTNTPPGTYTFRVVASNNDGVWNTRGDLVSIVIEPFLYQRKSFQYGLIAVIGGLALGAFGIRIRAHKVREGELTRLVTERTLNLKVEKERAETALADAQLHSRRAEEANAFKTELLGIAAHDMKSPLIAIKMFSQIVSGESGLSGEGREFAGEIHTSAQRLLDLINELLESSSVESGAIQLHPTSIELGRLAASVLDEQLVHAERKGQALRIEAIDDAWVLVDEQRTRQVIENLVNNAIKYSPRNAEIFVNVQRYGSTVRCAVVDRGPGLGPEDLEKLFGRFQRLTPRPTDGEPSTGLGLSIAKKLVELQSGRIWGESDLGHGCTFTVEFPSHHVHN